MKKSLPFVALCCMLSLGTAATLAACNKENIIQSDDKNITSVEVKEGTIPAEIFTGGFDDAGIKLIITYSDESTEEISVNSEMIPDEYKTYLTTPGTYSVVILFKDNRVQVELKIVEPHHLVNFYAYTQDGAEYKLVSSEDILDSQQPAEPHIEGDLYIDGLHYTFDKWDKDFSTISSDLEIYAQYKSVEFFAVDFYNGKNELISSQKIDKGKDAVEPTAEERDIEDYDFIGWDRSYLDIQKSIQVYGLYTSISKVSDPLPKISLNNSYLILGVSEMRNLTPILSDDSYLVTWRSTDTRVVSVDNGMLTAVGVGEAMVHATILGTSIRATCTVKVIEGKTSYLEDEHTFDEWTITKEATCTQTGSKKHRCIFCGFEEIETIAMLSHEYQKGDDGLDVVVWSKLATCTEKAEGLKTCVKCGTETAVTSPALGHTDELIGEAINPESGRAKAEVKHCTVCGETRLSFKATDVTEESKQRLVIDNDGGARFWGRPIGNAVELDETGSADYEHHDPIFDESETGDYFELIFDLTNEQVRGLGETCLLYCDAKPAEYMNNMDFWACKEGDTEWTPGYYIQGEHKGEQITDFRYILYVDGEPVSFDSTMAAPVPNNNGSPNLPREEYIMPYKFNLHAGTNIICLRMAGGWRSTFYNFIFKPAA